MSWLFNSRSDDRKPRDCGIIYHVTDKQSAHTTTIFLKREQRGAVCCVLQFLVLFVLACDD